jgi:hypothetical protein
MTDIRKHPRMFVILMMVIMIVQTIPTIWEDAEATDIVLHISTLSDGRPEKTLSFSQPGTDKTLSIRLPNGARVISAKMNVTGLPYINGSTDYPKDITIDMGNDGATEWAFNGTGYGQMGFQTVFSNGAPLLYVNLPQNGGTNATPSVRLPKNAVVTSAKMNISAGPRIGSPGKILIIHATNTNPFLVSDIRNWLKQYPDIKTVDDFDGGSGTPTWDLLQEYCTIILYDYIWYDYPTWFDSETLGNRMADYVDAGGGVVLCHFLWSAGGSYNGKITGRFDPNYYCWYPNIIALSGYGPPTIMSSVLLPNHPIMKGVNNITIPNGTLGGSMKLLDGAQNVFKWSDGHDACAVRTINNVNRVDIQMFPYTSAAPTSIPFGGWSGDGGRLIKNSLSWTSGGGPLNCSMDIANDGGIDWMNHSLYGNETIPNVTSQINAYLAKAPPNGTDDFGNMYVDVPIAVSSNSSGDVRLGNLSIYYKCTSSVDANPTTGNLSGGINAVLPKKYDGNYSNIPIAVFSNHTGKVKISNISIDYTPPTHPAIIKTRSPGDSIVMMDENSTKEFRITAIDPYDYPMCFTWSIDNKVYLKDTCNITWFADFNANGTHNITVTVDNGLEKVANSWMVIVRNVNRNPVIDSFNPASIFQMDENSSQTFEVSATDPDGDALDYTWHFDGKNVHSAVGRYDYHSTYFSAGKHEVKVTVMDINGGGTTHTWDLTVNDVNAMPEIADFSPPGDTVTMPENSSMKFSISDASPDGDKQSVSWSLDGNDTGMTGRSYNYTADFESAGTHTVQAEVSDGKASAKRQWTVTVTDVNRPPVARIAYPAQKAEFMLGNDIAFDGSASSDPDGDSLTLTWSEGGKPLGTGNTTTTKLAKGKHIITLDVDDGRSDGTATTQVEIYVRYIDLNGTVTVDNPTPTEGQKVVVTASLTNKGDGTQDELPVFFRIDGKIVSTTALKNIEPDSDYLLEFSWKAVKGDHKLEVGVNDQNFSKTVKVAQKPDEASDKDFPLIIIGLTIVTAVAVVTGITVYTRRKNGATALRPRSGR